MARQIRNHKAGDRYRLLAKAVNDHGGRTVVVTHLRTAGVNDRIETMCKLVAAAWCGVEMTHGSPLLVVQPVEQLFADKLGDAVRATSVPIWIPSTYVLTIERKTP